MRSTRLQSIAKGGTRAGTLLRKTKGPQVFTFEEAEPSDELTDAEEEAFMKILY